MGTKYFILSNERNPPTKEERDKWEAEKAKETKERLSKYEAKNRERLNNPPPLFFVDGRVVIQIDLQSKNWHTFKDGTKIRLERQYNELNRRLTEAVNAVVVSAKNIPSGTEILIHPNAASETNKIHDALPFSGTNLDTHIQYFSIPEDQCFIWKDEHGNWQPLPPYETALRVFEPYTGFLEGIEPTQLKDTLYVTSGDLKGSVVATVKAADYEIVFQNVDGREGRIIRFRPNGDDRTGREPEAIALLNDKTDRVKNGELFVGISKSDAKPINELVYG